MTTTRPLSAPRGRWLLLALFVACEPVDLVVVAVPDGGTFTPPDSGEGCASMADCLAGELCEKPSCGAALGRCRFRPLASACPPELRPLCGCDGITYANDCLRRAGGAEAVADRGQCAQPLRCDTSSPCPSGAHCARLVFPTECGRVAVGACWVVPEAACASGLEHFIPCGQPQSQCLDLCGAVRAEQPMARLPAACP